jgi:hypothetical protein
VAVATLDVVDNNLTMTTLMTMAMTMTTAAMTTTAAIMTAR